MAENITPSQVSARGSVEPLRSGRMAELVKLTGSSTAAGDTSTAYVCQNITAPAFCVGAATISSISGRSVVFKSLVALGSDSCYVWVYDAI
jgi:hypothetical protein